MIAVNILAAFPAINITGVLGISKDVALVHFAGIYTGIGLGLI